MTYTSGARSLAENANVRGRRHHFWLTAVLIAALGGLTGSAHASPEFSVARGGSARGAGLCSPGTTLFMTGRVRYAPPGCSDETLYVTRSLDTLCTSEPVNVPEPVIPAPVDIPGNAGCSDAVLTRARVELWLDVAPDGPGNEDVLLVASATDADGLFAFCRISAPDSAVDLYVSVKTCADGTTSGDACGTRAGTATPFSVASATPSGQLFTASSNTALGLCTGYVHWDIVDRRSLQSGGQRIFDLLANEAFDALANDAGWVNDLRLLALFPDELDRTGFSPAGTLLTIAAGDVQDDDQILKAYAYFVLYELYGEAFPPHLTGCPGHGWGTPVDAGCAWIHGAAAFLQGGIQNDASFDDTPAPGVPDPSPIDMEVPTPSATGVDDEGAVASALWDLFDDSGSTEPWDDLALGLGPIVDALAQRPASACAFFDLFPVATVEPILTEHGIDCVPLVVNIVTHGFNPKPPPLLGTWEEFRAPWYALAAKLDGIPDPGTLLDGRIATYVAEWESSDGFWDGFVELLMAKIAEASFEDAINKGNLEDAENFGALEVNLKTVAALVTVTSAVHAVDAAKRIAADVVDRYLLPDPAESSARQRIHLIGHSRGAAVNARVSKLLTDAGYYVDQFTSLDGYSRDWPDDGSLVADIDIVDEASVSEPAVGRKVNYRVEVDLANAIVSAENELSEAIAARVNFNGSGFDLLSPDVRAILRLNDLRAPERAGAGFEDLCVVGPTSGSAMCSEPTQGESNHLNVVDLYASSDELAIPDYILDNYVGQNRSTPRSIARPAAPGREVVGAPVPRASSGLDVEGASDFRDGHFEALGAVVQQLTDSAPAQSGVAILDLTYELLTDPAEILRQLWNVTGDVELLSDAGNSLVELTGSTGTSLGQLLLLGNAANRLSFDVWPLASASDDTLVVSFDGEPVRTLVLADLVEAKQAVLVGGLAGRTGLLKFELHAQSPDSAVVRMDDFEISECVPGDCNRNGVLDAGDPVCNVLCLIGDGEPSSDCSCAADCNCSLTLEAADPVCTVLRLIDAFEGNVCSNP